MKETVEEILKNDIVNQITKKPKFKNNMYGHYTSPYEGYKAQADLIEMPLNDNYKYILIIVDIFNRKIDMEPLKDKKALTILNAFKKILTRNIIKKMEILCVDNGNEFKGSFYNYLHDENIFIIYSIKYLGIIDSKIGLVSRILNKIMLKQKINNEKMNWLTYLFDVRDYVNNTYSLKNIKEYKNTTPILKRLNIKKVDIKINKEITKEKGSKIEILPINSKVRYYRYNLDDDTYYKDGRKREGDIRWSPHIYKIVKIIIRNDSPVYYKLDGINNNIFIRQELLRVDKFNDQYDILTHKKKYDKMVDEFDMIKSKINLLVKLYNNHVSDVEYLKKEKFDLIRDIIKLNHKIKTVDIDNLNEKIKKDLENKYNLSFR
jgi:hypothetical protein